MSVGRLRRPRARHQDAGIGLPELLVAMAVFTVVLTALGAVVIGSLDSVRSSTTKTAATADSRTAMEAVSRSLRVAVAPTDGQAAIAVATPTSITFYASLCRPECQRETAVEPPTGAQVATRPTRVTYAYGRVGARTCFTETQVPATVNTGADRLTRPLVWTGTGTPKCLAETTAGPSPTFSYYDSASLDAAPLAPTGTGLLPADLPRVLSVGVTLTVRPPAARESAGVVVSDRVSLGNVAAAASDQGVS